MSRVKLNSPRVEVAALRGLLHPDPQVNAPLFSSLDESYFSSEEAREIFSYIREHAGRDGKVPKYKLMLDDPGLSRDARSFLRDSNASLSSKAESKKAVQLLTKYRQARALARMVHLINDGLAERRLDPMSVIDRVSNELASARAVRADHDSVLHFGKNSNSYDMLELILNGDRSEDCIPTGLKVFDVPNMGWLRSSLVTIGGPSGAGKSQLAASISESVASFGYKVAMIPLEMSHLEMTARFYAKIARMDSMRILQGRLTKEEKKLLKNRVLRWEKRVARLGGRYTIYKPGGDVLIEEAYDGVEAFNPDMTVLDYVSLLRTRPGVDQWKQLGDDARYAKINAETRNRVNVLLCQVNEEGKIRYARAITEHSSNSWIFKADKEQNILQVEQVKSRNQNGFPFTLKIDYPTSTVTDVEGWEDGASTSSQSSDSDLTNLAQEV